MEKKHTKKQTTKNENIKSHHHQRRQQQLPHDQQPTLTSTDPVTAVHVDDGAHQITAAVTLLPQIVHGSARLFLQSHKAGVSQ